MVEGLNYKPKETFKKFGIKGAEGFIFAQIMIRSFNNLFGLHIQELEVEEICGSFAVLNGGWASFMNWWKNRKK